MPNTKNQKFKKNTWSVGCDGSEMAIDTPPAMVAADDDAAPTPAVVSCLMRLARLEVSLLRPEARRVSRASAGAPRAAEEEAEADDGVIVPLVANAVDDDEAASASAASSPSPDLSFPPAFAFIPPLASAAAAAAAAAVASA